MIKPAVLPVPDGATINDDKGWSVFKILFLTFPKVIPLKKFNPKSNKSLFLDINPDLDLESLDKFLNKIDGRNPIIINDNSQI